MNETGTETAAITKPSEVEIEETISKIYDKLELPEMALLKNAAAREGLEEAVDILVDDIRDYRRISAKSVQGRAIAVLAVDYLLGECSQEVLVRVPVKK